ncbi:universal stress protein [Micromonospora sp. NPDC049559]|uniref:universal stress protein n=1 Tax=Micromonospora sp. NPDC049559 TaxID=3155923 RepID=UPI00344AAA80
MRTDPILVGFDGSDPARAALDWALDEAARTGQPVRLLYVFEWVDFGSAMAPGIGPGGWHDEVAWREVEAMLRAVESEAATTHPGVRVGGEVADGPASGLLLERSAQAALVVLGHRGHGGFAGLLAGSTAVAVSSHAHCPVVVVRGEPRRKEPVVVGVDGSRYSLLALDFALDRAATRRVPLRVVRTWTPPSVPWRSPELNLAEVDDAERAAVRELLAPRRERYPGVEVDVEVVAGNPSVVLADAARAAQLVVVGSRGRGGFTGLLLGSVSQQLINHSECPVAVVRELGQSSGAR